MDLKFLRKIIVVFGVVLSLLFLSCNELSDPADSSNDSYSRDGKAHLSLSVNQSSSRNTIMPQNVSEKDFVKAVLSCKASENETVAVLKTWTSAGTASVFTQIQSEKSLSVEPGTYIFTLDLYTSDTRITQSGTVSQTVSSGSNRLEFNTKYVSSGELSITLNFTNDDRIGLIKAGLFTIASYGTEVLSDGKNSFDMEELSISDADGTCFAVYSPKAEVPNGSYFVKFVIYDSDKRTVLNSLIDIVKVHGYKTEEERTLSDINTIYNINYELNGGEWKSEAAQNVKTKRNANTGIWLPTNLTKETLVFAGWYTDSEFTTKIDVIGTGSEFAKDYNLYARWIDADLFVSGMGDDASGDGSEENPYESIDKACEKIIEVGTSLVDWAVFIVGDVTGPHDGTNKAGSRRYTKDYGRTIIPAELTSEHAKSLLLIGATGVDSDGLPQDLLNRGLEPGNTTQTSDTGTALVVETTVPVTIKNLKITNSNNAQSNGSSETFNRKGGGLAISSVSTVSLSDGVWITNNKGYYGGGVYNAGTLYIYGSAVIGNRSQEKRANQAAANSSEDGGGIYNEGKIYLGYSEYVDEENNVEEDWIGCINYNYSWRGGAINNRGNAVIVFRDGTIAHNDTVHGGGSGGGGGIYNYGSVVMTGGVLEYNYDGGNSGGGGLWNGRNSSYGTGVFSFSGGKIQNNEAGSGNNGVNGGGGVYNNGIMYVYGDAVIGDESASGIATGAEDCSNVSAGEGAGIYVAASGELYMGYSDYTSEAENTPAQWNKGIYHNYSKTYGGGLCLANGCTILFNTGTIANNGAEKAGGALYVFGDGFTLSGTATIPAGDGDVKQSILVKTNNYSLFIDNSLSHIDDKSMYLLPDTNSDGTSYNTYKPLIRLTDAATNAGLTIDSVKDKFVVGSYTNSITGIVTNWTLNSEGKAVQDIVNLYVSCTGSDDNDGLSSTTALGSITAAISKINKLDDSTKDYVITLDGEITGAQVIEDPAGGKIKTNTIKIVGSKSSNLSDTNSAASGIPKDIVNANLSDSEIESALTINTTVPVTLRGIMLTGGHGNEIGSGDSALIAGGGLFIGEGATVSFENYAMVTENTAGNSEKIGDGAGVYISNGAKLVMNYKTKVCNNVGTHYGAGIYVANGGYLKTISGSESDIYENALEQSDTAVTVKGGGIYLEDGATLEQLGTYVRRNSVSAGGLGSGIYMCSTANYMISGYAQTNLPNDVYMETGAQIEVIGSISSSPTARLTLESYPVDGGAEIYPVKLADGLTWTNSTIASRFEITPQSLEGGEIQYWALDTSSGKLTKKAGMAVSISVPSGLSNDIEVMVTDSSGTSLSADGSSFTGGSTLTFTAQEGYATYTWKIDGKEQSAVNNILFDTSSCEAGTYVLYLEAKDSAGKYYSYTAQIKVSKGE